MTVTAPIGDKTISFIRKMWDSTILKVNTGTHKLFQNNEYALNPFLIAFNNIAISSTDYERTFSAMNIK